MGLFQAELPIGQTWEEYVVNSFDVNVAMCSVSLLLCSEAPSAHNDTNSITIPKHAREFIMNGQFDYMICPLIPFIHLQLPQAFASHVPVIEASRFFLAASRGRDEVDM